MRAEPYPTYVSADWARNHPDKYPPDKYGAKAVTGFETILNIIKSEISGEQTWGLTVDENAPGYVKGVTKTLNWIGSTWGRAVDGAWMATDAAFNFASFLIDANNKDKELIQAMMDLLGTATTVITAPVKATLAVGAVNMYPGMGIEFNYAAPKPAASPSRSNDNSKQGLTNEEQSLIDATSLPTNIGSDNPLVIGDYVADTPDYAAAVAAENER